MELHRILGIERAVIVHASCHGSDMRVTLDGIARSGGRMRGVAVVDPGVTDAELAALDAGGIRGVRFNFVKHLGGMPDMAFFERVLAQVEPLGWHVVLHLDAEDVVELAPRIARIRVPFVIDHMGRVKAKNGLEQAPFRQLLELMRNPLAWVKICGAERVSSAGAPFRDAVPFARALVEAGARSRALGHRLAAPEHRRRHAERRRPGGPARGGGRGRGRAPAGAGGQPDAPLLGAVTPEGAVADGGIDVGDHRDHRLRRGGRHLRP